MAFILTSTHSRLNAALFGNFFIEMRAITRLEHDTDEQTTILIREATLGENISAGSARVLTTRTLIDTNALFERSLPWHLYSSQTRTYGDDNESGPDRPSTDLQPTVPRELEAPRNYPQNDVVKTCGVTTGESVSCDLTATPIIAPTRMLVDGISPNHPSVYILLHSFDSCELTDTSRSSRALLHEHASTHEEYAVCLGRAANSEKPE